jgi:hypothetical protein
VNVLLDTCVWGKAAATLRAAGHDVVWAGHPHSGIVRLVGFRAAEQGVAAVEVLDRYRSELQAGAILTVEPGRIRVREGP